MSESEKKNKAAVELGRKGGLKGGHARAKVLTPEQRSESASIAARARWEDQRKEGSKVPRATHAGELKIGELVIPCFVLEDGKRVISQNGMASALKMTRGGTRKVHGDRIANFLAGNALKPFVSERLTMIPNLVVRFRLPQGGIVANGYEATILADICDLVLTARRAGAIGERYAELCSRSETLMSGFARVGIIALVDEATGYQDDRARDALAKILEKFIAKELQPYVPTFPVDYYKETYRLRRWQWAVEAETSQRPPLIGKLTNNVVYARLAPGVLKELRRTIPRREDGRLKHHMHRKLTADTGHPKLREHLVSVVTMMKMSKNWDDFMVALDRIHPKYGTTYQLDF